MVSNLGFLQLAPLGLAFGRPPAEKAQGNLTQTQGGGGGLGLPAGGQSATS